MYGKITYAECGQLLILISDVTKHCNNIMPQTQECRVWQFKLNHYGKTGCSIHGNGSSLNRISEPPN